jgi:hypothetical protein
MNNKFQKLDQVSICKDDNCIHASGQNAEMIAKGATVMLILIGIAALIRAASN